MWSRPPSMPWCSCAIAAKWQLLAASRYRSYIDGSDFQTNDAPGVLSLCDFHSREAQAGNQGIGLHPAQSSGGARGYGLHPWHGQDRAALGADRQITPPTETNASRTG